MATTQYKGKRIGGPSEYTVSEVIHESIESLIDRGKRFTIVNDDESEEDYKDGNRYSDH